MIWILLALSIVGWSSGHSLNQSTDLRNSTLKDDESFKGRQISNYVGMISCVANYDVSCFLDVAQDYLELKRTELLVEADAEALKSTGRADPDAKPSYLAELIGKLIKEFGGMFRGGFGGFLQSREGEDDDDTEDSDEEDDGDSTEVSARSSTGGTYSLITPVCGLGRRRTFHLNTSSVRTSSSKQLRKKKKNKEGIITKIVRFVKYIVYVLTLYFMIHTAIAMFNSFLMFKMVAAIMWAVAIFALKVWILHKGSGDQVVVHEDVHHEHHYENDDHYDHVPVDDWSSYSRKDYAHNLAYREQKPTPSSGLLSWFN